MPQEKARPLDGKAYSGDVTCKAESGVGFGVLTKWERDLVMPRVDLVYYVAQALGVSIEYLMGWEDEQDKG